MFLQNLQHLHMANRIVTPPQSPDHNFIHTNTIDSDKFLITLTTNLLTIIKYI